MLIEYPRRRPPHDPAPNALALALVFAVAVSAIFIATRTDLRAAHRITWQTRSAGVPAAP